MILHDLETGDAGAGLGGSRTGRKSIDSDAVRSQVKGKIPDDIVECGLGHTHELVAGNDLFAGIIGHGQNAAAPVLHERERAPGQRNQRIRADIHSQGKIRTRDVHKTLPKRRWRGIRNRVNQIVQMPELLPDLIEQPFNLFVLTHIALGNQRIIQLVGDISHHTPDSPTLNGEGNPRAAVVEHLGDGPADGIFVQHPRNQGGFPGEVKQACHVFSTINHCPSGDYCPVNRGSRFSTKD